MSDKLDVSNWTTRQHVMYGLGYALGWLRGRWVPLLLFAGLCWVFIKILPFLRLMVVFGPVVLFWLAVGAIAEHVAPTRRPRINYWD